MRFPISRRQLLAGVTAASALSVVGCTTENKSRSAASSFQHGVASGDPDHNSLVIWTRVSTDKDFENVSWEVAKDIDFNDIVASGNQTTSAERDFTVKVLVNKLLPGSRYFYRFKTAAGSSMIGRTKTLANGHVSQLGLAVASCSNFPFGYFNAYDAIAKDEQVDLVLHLGDYIYEYAEDGWGGKVGKEIGRVHLPAHEIVSLADYRQRHAQYKTDHGSQHMHAAHPLIPIWDDHETTNNPWMNGAQNHQPETEGDWSNRRSASLQAYYEWMPIREPSIGMSRAQYWRNFSYGDLADIITLETRHTGRALQIDYAEHLPKIKTAQDRDRFMQEVLADPERNMLSKDMESFLDKSLRNSVSEKRRWRIIANQIPMARTHVPSLKHPFFNDLINGLNKKDPSDAVAEEWKVMGRVGELDLPFYLDTWDGYGAARERFYDLCAAAGAKDLLVLTGDSHAYWQNQLFNQKGERMGVEIGTTGISSPGDFLRLGLEGAELLDNLVAEHNPEVIYTDNRYNGYVRVVLDHDKAATEFVTVSTVLKPEYKTEVVRSFNVVNDQDSLNYTS